MRSHSAMYAFVGLFAVALVVTVAMHLSLRQPSARLQAEAG